MELQNIKVNSQVTATSETEKYNFGISYNIQSGKLAGISASANKKGTNEYMGNANWNAVIAGDSKGTISYSFPTSITSVEKDELIILFDEIFELVKAETTPV